MSGLFNFTFSMASPKSIRPTSAFQFFISSNNTAAPYPYIVTAPLTTTV